MKEQSRIWVVEGPDNSGKTTLAQKLAKRLGGLYVKGEYVAQPESDVLRFNMWLSMAPGDRLVICDRHPVISDPIYAAAVRQRPSPLGSVFCQEVQSYLNIIYCRPPMEEILRFGNREQMEGVIENGKRIIQGYDQWWQDLPDFPGVERLQYSWAWKDVHKKIIAEDMIFQSILRHHGRDL